MLHISYMGTNKDSNWQLALLMYSDLCTEKAKNGRDDVKILGEIEVSTETKCVACWRIWEVSEWTELFLDRFVKLCHQSLSEISDILKKKKSSLKPLAVTYNTSHFNRPEAIKHCSGKKKKKKLVVLSFSYVFFYEKAWEQAGKM